MPRPSRSYTLTPALVASYGGSDGVVCLDARALGRDFRLYAERPGPHLNSRVLPPTRSDVVGSGGTVQDVQPAGTLEGDAGPVVVRVDICGPLEQRAGYHDPCGGWSDGHDAITERFTAACEEGDVLLVIDSPGGANAGLGESVRRCLAAKAEHGRTVTVYADEMIGSAAAYYALALGDRICIPPSGIFGSIGARAAHASVAGQLAQDGVEVTYFAAPDAGKVAFAPELPLSDLGKERGERDVWDAYLGFEAAVCAGPIGKRNKLTPEKIRALKADALTGWRAVEAGLVDDVASLEDTMNYALATAGGGEQAMPEIDNAVEYEKMTRERYSDDGKDPKPDDDPDNDGDDDEDEDEEEDNTASADALPPPAPPPAKKKMAQPPPPAKSLADALGQPATVSRTALDAASLPRLSAFNAIAARLGVSAADPGAVWGAFLAVERDAAETPGLRERARKAEAVSESAEREKILDAMVREGKAERAEVWRTRVNKTTQAKERVPRSWCGPEKTKNGERVGMSLASLRSFAKAATVKRPQTPFAQPDPDATPVEGAIAVQGNAARWGVKPEAYSAAERLVRAAATNGANGAQIVRVP